MYYRRVDVQAAWVKTVAFDVKLARWQSHDSEHLPQTAHSQLHATLREPTRGDSSLLIREHYEKIEAWGFQEITRRTHPERVPRVAERDDGSAW
jgi:hypothetical protein